MQSTQDDHQQAALRCCCDGLSAPWPLCQTMWMGPGSAGCLFQRQCAPVMTSCPMQAQLQRARWQTMSCAAAGAPRVTPHLHQRTGLHWCGTLRSRAFKSIGHFLIQRGTHPRKQVDPRGEMYARRAPASELYTVLERFRNSRQASACKDDRPVGRTHLRSDTCGPDWTHLRSAEG